MFAGPNLINLALKSEQKLPQIGDSKHKRHYYADFEEVSCLERQLSS